MNRPPSRRLAAVLAGFVAVGSGTAIVVASVALLGWGAGNERLTTLFVARGPTMNPITALAALSAGIALALMRSPGASRVAIMIARACAACTAGIGIARLVGYALPLRRNVDELLFASRLSDNPLGPSRMAFGTALAFASIGMALLLLD